MLLVVYRLRPMRRLRTHRLTRGPTLVNTTKSVRRRVTLALATAAALGTTVALAPNALALNTNIPGNCSGGVYGSYSAKTYCTYGPYGNCFRTNAEYDYNGGHWPASGDWRWNAGGTWSGILFNQPVSWTDVSVQQANC